MNVTETNVEVNLLDLLDHTALRLHKYLEEVIQTNTEKKKNLKIYI